MASRIGYQNAYPVSVTKDGVLWDGNNRLAAAKMLGWEEIPHITETPDNLRLAAHRRNEAAENNLSMTFVDDAVEIWELLSEGKTQQQVADEKGWSRTAVLNYSRLQSIYKGAWEIVDTEVKRNAMTRIRLDVSNNDTTVSFTEGLLRSILPLTPDHQHELVDSLINDPRSL